MYEQDLPGYVPKSHYYLWLVLRCGIMAWGIYGMFHGSVVEFLEAVFAILFTHMWDYFQVFGGNAFVIRVPYLSGTMLNLFIFIGVVIGSTLNNRTGFAHFDIVTHFGAGLIGAVFGYDFAVIMQTKHERLSPALASLFSIAFSLAIAVGWEIYEFTMDRLYGLSLQRSIPTSEIGLLDTMSDFICATGGALLGMFLIAFYRNGKFGKYKKSVRRKIEMEKFKSEKKEELWHAYLLENGAQEMQEAVEEELRVNPKGKRKRKKKVH